MIFKGFENYGFELMVVAKFLLGLFFSLVILFFLKFKKEITAIFNKKPIYFYFGLIFISRILPFIIIYLVLGYDSRSDVNMFFDSALKALQGGFVYKDFDSAYSPLFSYITALPLIFWNSAKAIILLMIFIEALVAWFTYKYYSESIHSAINLVLYFFLPGSFVFTVLGGQEDLWMWAFVLWAIYKSKSNPVFQGIILGIGLLCTKALLVLYIPAILIFSQKPFKILIGLLIVGVPSLVILYINSELLFLSPIQQANDPRTPNIWTILHPLTNGLIPLGPKILNWVGLISIQTISIYFAFKLRKNIEFDKFLVFNFLLISIWLMIIQQSSLANYTLVFLLPLVFFFDFTKNKKHLFIFLAFNIMVTVQPAIWWGMGMPVFHTLSDLSSGFKLAEYFLEIGIIAGLIWLMFLVINKINLINE
jgi:hypothetical protein